MSIVYADEENLASERGWQRGVVPVDPMGLLQGETKLLGIEGEGGACIEVFLCTAEYGV